MLWEFARDGFSLYFCGGRSQPTIIVGAYEWDDYLLTWLDRLAPDQGRDDRASRAG